MKWFTYNQSPVRRGELLLGFDVIDNWDTELKEMTTDKVGEPFHYPNTFLLLLGYARVYFHLPYRQTNGIAQGYAKGKMPSIPDYTTISRIINRLDIKIQDKNKELEDDYIVIAIYSTDIKVRKKSYLKIHIATNVKANEILSMKITD
ncbi:MAG: transposase [Thermoproteota archaeon]|nr:transposase [Thermoproteota archaeon]